MGAVKGGWVYEHSMLLHGSDEEMLGAVVPFLREGIRSGQGVVVCCRPDTTRLVQRELGPGGHSMMYLDYQDTFSTPIGAVAAYQMLVDEYLSVGAERVRVIAEAVYDRTPDEHVEWARYEAVANRAMELYPVSAICLYDRRRTPADLLALGLLTHPTLVTGTRQQDNPDYVLPAEFLRRMNEPAPDPLEAKRPDLEVTGVSDLDRLRAELERCLFQTTHMPNEAADLVLAANEVTTNALRHGRPPVHVRLWVTADRCVCTVSDHGPGIRDPFAGYIWPGALSRPPTHGMGLWLARRLCDRVDVIETPEGCTVRLIIHCGHPASRTAAGPAPTSG
jgi:anti-sigma regulatory factor (Ser/Thr protein kinase)